MRWMSRHLPDGALSTSSVVCSSVCSASRRSSSSPEGSGPPEPVPFFEAVAFFTIATSLVVFGFDESMVRAVSRLLASGEVRALRRTLLVALVPLLAFAGVVAIVVWASAPQVARFVEGESSDGGLAGYLRIFAIALPFTAMYYAILAATRGFGTMVPTVAIERVGRTGAQALGAGLVVAGGGSVNILTLTWALPFIVGPFLGAWQLRRLDPPGGGSVLA